MKTMNFLYLLILLLIISDFSLADSPGDINNDHVIGLPEAIYALGVTAGVYDQKNLETYDFKNYFFVDGSEFFYKKNYYDEIAGQNLDIYEYVHHLAKEINGQKTFIECWYSGSTYQEYYTINYLTLYLAIGDYWNGWYDGHIQVASTSFAPGDVFSSLYKINALPYWCEYKFLGLEDVETQAGVFKDCLKISKINAYEWGILFSYYALNTGLVKQVYASSNDSYILELIATKNKTATYPDNLDIKRYNGSWNIASTSTSDSITFFYLPQNGNLGTLIFHNFPFIGQYKTISLESTDGLTFVPCNSTENISASLSGTSIIGSYTYPYIDETTLENTSIELSFSGNVFK